MNFCKIFGRVYPNKFQLRSQEVKSHEKPTEERRNLLLRSPEKPVEKRRKLLAKVGKHSASEGTNTALSAERVTSITENQNEDDENDIQNTVEDFQSSSEDEIVPVQPENSDENRGVSILSQSEDSTGMSEVNMRAGNDTSELHTGSCNMETFKFFSDYKDTEFRLFQTNTELKPRVDELPNSVKQLLTYSMNELFTDSSVEELYKLRFALQNGEAHCNSQVSRSKELRSICFQS